MNVYIHFIRKLDTRAFDPGVCWEWLGADKGNGYGNFNFDGETMPAHRAAYLLFVGPIADGLDVCHSCDNRPCCNPEHLFVGTRTDNMQDAKRKGRISRGVRVPAAKLTEAQVLIARDRLLAGHPSRAIAKDYNVTRGAIDAIARGDAWSHITGGRLR